MVKYTIEESDIDTFRHHLNGPKYHATLVDIYQTLRNKSKHGGDEFVSWDEPYELVLDILNEDGIELYG